MFKKGDTAVYINTKVKGDGKGGVAPVVSIEKLKELAASRL